MGILLQRNALDVNRPNANRHLTNGGSNWLWAVTAIFAVSFLGWLIWSFILPGSGNAKHNSKSSQPAVATTSTTGRARDPERIFHYLFIIAAFAGLVAYFTMASNLGNTPIRQYLNHGRTPLQTREIFYARYCYWFVAWPMVIIATLIVSGVSWATIAFAVLVQEIWVVCWLCGALTTTRYKWGYFVLGLVAYFVLSAILLVWGSKHAKLVRSKHYMPLAGLLVFIWAIYSIAWGLSEGGNRLSVTREHIFYGVLDLISVPLFGWAFLALSRSWDHGDMGLHYTQGRVSSYDGGMGHHDQSHLAGQPGVVPHATHTADQQPMAHTHV